jgi:hypothetical protein
MIHTPAAGLDDFDPPTKPEWLTLSLQRHGSELRLVDEPRLAAKVFSFIVAGVLTGAAVAIAFEAIRGWVGR